MTPDFNFRKLTWGCTEKGLEQDLATLEAGRRVRRLLQESKQKIRTSFKIELTKMERFRQMETKQGCLV